MCDLIIIGAGPAGLTASIYASRYQINHLVIGKSLGGEIASSYKVENYPGLPAISGLGLSKKMEEHAKELGAKIRCEGIARVEKERDSFKLTSEAKKVYRAGAVIIATGTERRKLGIPGEEEYTGRGVTYCATCDAPLFSGKTVAVVGGANAAAQGALLLAEYAKRVCIVYWREALRADPIFVKRIEEQIRKEKIRLFCGASITKIEGDGKKVTGVVLGEPQYKKSCADKRRGAEVREKEKKLALDGVFIEIGGVPGTALVRPLGVKLDKKGFIKVDLEMKTNIPGLFAAGDITSSGALLQQVVTACAQGAMAASSAYKFLKEEKEIPR